MKRIILLVAIIILTFSLAACDENGNIDQDQFNNLVENTMSLTELSSYDGANGMPVYIAVNGIIYDVTEEFPDGMHREMEIGGKDVTFVFEASPHMNQMLLELTVVGRLTYDGNQNTVIKPDTTTETASTSQEELPVFTIDEISAYTGENGSTAYIAVEGVVYDVTQAFDNGAHQGMQLGGTDATAAFSASPHSQSLLDTLDIIGSLEGYPVITVTVENNDTTMPTTPTESTDETLPVFTLDDLANYTGQNGSKAYLAVSGVVYDGSDEFYNGMHQGFQLGGVDATSIFAASPHAASILTELPIVGSLEGYPLITITEAHQHNGYDDEEYDDDDMYDDDDQYITLTDLPQSIIDYIEANHPSNTVEEAELEDGYYEVELSNELELYFDLDGNFLSSEYDD